MKAAYSPHKISAINPLRDNVIVSDMKFDERLSSGGIVLLNDDMQNSGIRPRWAKVYAVGPLQKDVLPGQWILVSHGRWSRGIEIEDEFAQKTIRRIDPNDILLVSETPQLDETMSDKVL